MNWLIKNFLRGLVIVVPIALTSYLVYHTFLAADRLLRLTIPGLGIAVLVAATIAIGALASNFVIRKLLDLTERVFNKAPIVRMIYSAIKDLLEAFVGDKKRFDKPVAVSLDDTTGIRTLGFMTQEDLASLSMPGHVAVYMPFSYSFDGYLLIVPSSRVQRLETDSAKVMALVVSGGVSRA